MPYACDPTNSANKCKIKYQTLFEGMIDTNTNKTLDVTPTTIQASLKELQIPCRCALDGDNGYCESVLGTETMVEGLASVKALLEGNECHTDDRHDLRSLTEPCAGKKDESKTAIENMFKLRHWPYFNGGKVACIKKLFSDSYDNLSKTQAA